MPKEKLPSLSSFIKELPLSEKGQPPELPWFDDIQEVYITGWKDGYAQAKREIKRILREKFGIQL